jgi:hypothetical protein
MEPNEKVADKSDLASQSEQNWLDTTIHSKRPTMEETDAFWKKIEAFEAGTYPPKWQSKTDH